MCNSFCPHPIADTCPLLKIINIIKRVGPLKLDLKYLERYSIKLYTLNKLEP